jgi:L-lactate utilization protein LutB
MDNNIQSLLQTLRANNLSAHYLPDRHAAREFVLSLIPEGAVVGYGDSLTLRQIGLVEALESGSYTFLNPWAADTVEENIALKRRALTADVFVTGTNALTLDGALVNVDGHGNRTAAMLFGPEKVIVVVGVNKIVPDVKAARQRIREVAAPKNVAQHAHFDPLPPCGITGECADCSSPWRICNKTVIIRREFNNDRYSPMTTVVIVGEELGL